MLIDGEPVFENRVKPRAFNVVLAYFNLPLSERRELILEEFKLMTDREYLSMGDADRGKVVFLRVKERGILEAFTESIYERTRTSTE